MKDESSPIDIPQPATFDTTRDGALHETAIDREWLSAKQAGLISCRDCGQLNPLAKSRGQAGNCSRCGSRLHQRLPYSIQRTWAFVIASLIVFIPANTLPMMTVLNFGHGQPDTIISGILFLLKIGMVPVAIIVFIASFLVPLAKILGLMILLITVQRNSTVQPRHRTLLYRLVDLLGKWSMLDVFVVTIMTAVVNLGYISSIEAGAGATAFAVMVILTMFAAHSFDPRLIWDLAETAEKAETKASKEIQE
ncbi:MAG: paraquat-inducible protein A [Pseudomonadales bacterium]|nr:paraquat-inducible protein A [Pseudomonadales bacterium]